MLGFSDLATFLGYALMCLSAAFGIIWGFVYWNREV
jgi:hypothetical protein